MKKQITFEDFKQVDIQIGTIIKVTNFPKARKSAYQIHIDFGDLGIKKISTQITTLYTKETLIGKQIIAVVNFKAKQIANFMSECLLLGVQNENDVVLLKSNKSSKNGTPIN